MSDLTRPRLLHVLAALENRPWAIRLEEFEAIRDIVERHARGEAPDLSAVAAKRGRPLDNTDFVYQWRKQMARQYTLRALRALI